MPLAVFLGSLEERGASGASQGVVEQLESEDCRILRER
jgi:hypothetical protein